MRSARLAVMVFVVAILAVAVIPNAASGAGGSLPKSAVAAATVQPAPTAGTQCLQSVRCVGGGAMLPAGVPFTVVLWLAGVALGAALVATACLRRRPRARAALPRGALVRITRPPQFASLAS